MCAVPAAIPELQGQIALSSSVFWKNLEHAPSREQSVHYTIISVSKTSRVNKNPYILAKLIYSNWKSDTLPGYKSGYYPDTESGYYPDFSQVIQVWQFYPNLSRDMQVIPTYPASGLSQSTKPIPGYPGLSCLAQGVAFPDVTLACLLAELSVARAPFDTNLWCC